MHAAHGASASDLQQQLFCTQDYLAEVCYDTVEEADAVPTNYRSNGSAMYAVLQSLFDIRGRVLASIQLEETWGCMTPFLVPVTSAILTSVSDIEEKVHPARHGASYK